MPFSSESHHAKSLESLGHEVDRLQEGRATSEEVLFSALKSQLFVWVHTHGWRTPGENHMVDVLNKLKLEGVVTCTYHLDLWLGLDRQKDLVGDDFYQHIGHFFTVDKKMAEWLNANSAVRGHYLPAAVFDEECAWEPVLEAPINDVIFVGSRGYHPEWKYRPQLIDWLRATYGHRFLHVGGDGDTGTKRGAALNAIYQTSKVAVGDSLCLNFDYPWYWSDRVYETLGRGGFLIHPYVEGMGEHFEDGKHLKFYQYGDFDQLKGLIDYYLGHDAEREAIRKAGHEHVKANHTYKHRWAHILEVLGVN